MKIIFDVGFWVNIEQQENKVIFETSDDNGNDIELRFNKEGFFSKRHLKKLIEDLEMLSKSKGEKE